MAVDGWRVDRYRDTACTPAHLRSLIAWRTFALDSSGAEQKSTGREVFDLKACVSLMHYVETHQQIWEQGDHVGC